MSSSDDSESDHIVGYKRPPIATRFKKGKSGNPRGRPKDKKGIGTILRDTLYRKVEVRDGGRVRSISKIEALIEVNVNKGLKGDLRAFVKIMDFANKFGIADTFLSEREQAENKEARAKAFAQIAAHLEKVPSQGVEIHEDGKTDRDASSEAS